MNLKKTPYCWYCNVLWYIYKVINFLASFSNQVSMIDWTNSLCLKNKIMFWWNFSMALHFMLRMLSTEPLQLSAFVHFGKAICIGCQTFHLNLHIIDNGLICTWLIKGSRNDSLRWKCFRFTFSSTARHL
jgi:hypothetical protein